MAVVEANGRLICEIKLKVNSRIVRFPGVRDRGTSKQIELKISRLFLAQTYHQPVSSDLMDWVFDLPTRAPRLYQRLVAEGLVDGALLGRRKLNDLLFGEIEKRAGFDQAVKAWHRNGNTEEQARRKVLVKRQDLYVCKTQGMLQSMCASGVTPDHILETVNDADALLTGCGFIYWDDLDAERAKQWIYEQQSARSDFRPTTANHYITSAKAFAKWCKKQLKRDNELSPLEDLKKRSTRAMTSA